MATKYDGSILPQVMACCQMAPSHYLNQYWLLITMGVLWHSPDSNVTRSAHEFNRWHVLRNPTFKAATTSPRGQWVNNLIAITHYEVGNSSGFFLSHSFIFISISMDHTSLIFIKPTISFTVSWLWPTLRYLQHMGIVDVFIWNLLKVSNVKQIYNITSLWLQTDMLVPALQTTYQQKSICLLILFALS